MSTHVKLQDRSLSRTIDITSHSTRLELDLYTESQVDLRPHFTSNNDRKRRGGRKLSAKDLTFEIPSH